MHLGLGNTLVNNGLSNPDLLSLDLQFAADKTLTARRGPKPVLIRANTTATFIGSNGTIQNATTNVARFDHDKSYSSAYLVLSGSPVDSSSNAVDIAGPIEFAGWDESSPVQFPGFNYSNLSIGVAEGSYWLVYANDGEFQARRLITDGINGAYTVINGSGTLTVTAVHPCKGLLIEEQRGNILTNTNGDLSTQTKTVTAVQHTLSFYGTGQIELSGAATAVVSPAGNYGDRKTLTFTPSAGSLTLTVTGSVQFAQLEIGAFATSFIPTSGTSLIRSADVCSISGAAFSGFYNQSEGTVVSQTTKVSTNANAFIFAATPNNSTNLLGLRYSDFGRIAPILDTASANQITGIFENITLGSSPKQAFAYKLNNLAYSVNGATPLTDTSALIPSINSQVNIGASFSGNSVLNGHIASIRYFKKRLPNAKLQSLTTL